MNVEQVGPGCYGITNGVAVLANTEYGLSWVCGPFQHRRLLFETRQEAERWVDGIAGKEQEPEMVGEGI